MRPRLQTCWLLLAGVLLMTSPGSGGTIGSRDDGIHFESGSGTDPPGQEQTSNHPHWKFSPQHFHLQNVQTSNSKVGTARVSGHAPEEAPATSLEPSPGVTRQAEAPEPPKIRPLLDEDELVAFEMKKQKTALRPPANSSGATPAAAIGQSGGDKEMPSQLVEIFESILNEESDFRRQPTTQRPLQPHPTVHPPQPQTSKAPPTDAEGDVSHLLPALEETIGSIFEDIQDKTSTTTSRPVHPPMTDVKPHSTVHPLPPQTSKVPPTDAEEDVSHLLPALKETIGKIFEDIQDKTSTTTSRPVHPQMTDGKPHSTVHPLPPQTSKAPPTDAEEDVSHLLPALEETIGKIFEDIQDKTFTTTSRPVHPPMTDGKPHSAVHPFLLQTSKAPPTDAEEDESHLMPAIKEAIGSIFEDIQAKAPTTTSRPVLPPARLTTADGKQMFAAVLPQLEDTIRSILEEAAAQQEAAAHKRKHTTLPSARRPTVPTTKDYVFDVFAPALERVLGDIMHNSKSNHSATFPNTSNPTSTVTSPTDQQLSVHTNVIEQDIPSSDSDTHFQAVKPTLQDVLDHQERKANKPQP